MTQTPGQRTASTVLDLIDGAIGGDTSADAMRWTPSEPPKPPDFAAMVQALTDLCAPYAAAMTELTHSLGAYFKQVAPQIEVIAAYAEWAERVRRPRVRRIHTAYGRRRR